MRGAKCLIFRVLSWCEQEIFSFWFHCRPLFVALQPISGLGRVFFEVSTSHAMRRARTHAHTHTHIHTPTNPLKLLWTSDQPVVEALNYTNIRNIRTDIPALNGIWDQIPVIQRLEAYALDRTATEICPFQAYSNEIYFKRYSVTTDLFETKFGSLSERRNLYQNTVEQNPFWASASRSAIQRI